MKLKEFLNEKDIVGADKIYTKEEILRKIGFNKFKKLEDGTYEVWGDYQSYARKHINLIPVKIKIIHGNFKCSGQGLNSLSNCPEIVDGDFDCSSNKLKTLEGGPKIVKGDYICKFNGFSKQDVMEVCQVNGKINVSNKV